MPSSHSRFVLATLLFVGTMGGCQCAQTGELVSEKSNNGGSSESEMPEMAPGTAPELPRGWNGVARGVAWDANWSDRENWYGTKGAEKGLDRIKGIGVDWIAVTPFSYQPDVNKPELSFRDGWGRGLGKDVKNAHARGMKVMIKPHIWSNQFWDGSGHWRGTIRMKSEQDWVAWFVNYEKWIVAEAKKAQELKADAFCIGLEYLESSRKHANKWRKVIAAVREVYDGPITYGAHESEADLPFWDDLDFIGINAYFKLSDSNEPTMDEMRATWRKRGKQMAELAGKFDKPIVFTEVGFASVDGTAQAPHRWPREGDTTDEKEQADCYRSLFDVAGEWPWFGGMFIWKYKITVPDNNIAEKQYVFQDKLAEGEIKRGYTEVLAKPKP